MLDVIKTWQDCTRCKIASPHKVFYRGATNPLVLFIAPSIGHADTVTKKPLSGGPGKLLDQMAKDCLLSRKDYGVATLISCIALNNSDTSKTRDPSTEEIDNCSDRLNDVIESVLPKYYVAMGATVKKHAPAGIRFSFQTESPIKWFFSGGEMSLSYKRDRHKLKKFLRERK